MSIFNFRMLLSQSQQPRSGFMMMEVLLSMMLLGIAACTWSLFWVAMLDRMAVAQERALGYAYARSCMARFVIERRVTYFSEGDFEVTLSRYERFGRFCKIVLQVKGKRDTFYIYTGVYE